MSRLEIPGYPAPEMACIVVTRSNSIGPKAFSSAQRGMTHPVVEQFAFVTINPFFKGGERKDCCCGMMEKWEGLTRGTIRGT